MSDLVTVFLLALWIMSGYAGARMLRRKGRYDAHLQGHQIGDPLNPYLITENFTDPLLAYRLFPIVVGAFLLVAGLVLPPKTMLPR